MRGLLDIAVEQGVFVFFKRLEIAFHFVPFPRRERGEIAARFAAEVRPCHHVGKFARLRVGFQRGKQIGVEIQVFVACGLNHFVARATEFCQGGNFAFASGSSDVQVLGSRKQGDLFD